MADERTCLDCGLLSSTTRHPGTGELNELGKHDRDELKVEDRRNPPPVLCRGGYGDFHRSNQPTELRADLRRAACQSFEPYREGITPKEHQDMIDMREHRAWLDRQAKRDQDWRDALAQREKEWMDWQAEQAEKQSQRELKQAELQQEWHDSNLERSRVHMRTILAAAVLGAILGGGLNVVDRRLSPPPLPPVVNVYPTFTIPQPAAPAASQTARSSSSSR